MSDRVYYATCRIRENSSAQVIHVDSRWGLKVGDFVTVVMWNIDNPLQKVVATKVLSKRGSGIGFYCSRKWGFKTGDMVVYRMRKVNGSDSGVEAEDEDP